MLSKKKLKYFLPALVIYIKLCPTFLSDPVYRGRLYLVSHQSGGRSILLHYFYRFEFGMRKIC